MRDVLCFAAGIVVTLCCAAYMDSRTLLATEASSTLLLQLASQSQFSSSNNDNDNNNAASTSTSSSFDARASAQDATGFHPLHIYYGKNEAVTRDIPADKFWVPPAHPTQVSTHPGTRKWFSQHGQDVAVMKVLEFKRNGFFVDLAANDAIWASNTYTLEQHFDWRGICIEANPVYWHRLAYRHCHAVGAVVGNATSNVQVEMVLAADKVQAPYGGIVGTQFDNKGNKKGRQETVQRYTVPLATILTRFEAPAVIDYLSLDVEGAEWFILHQFPFDKYQFKCLTIERPSDQLQALLQKQGYVKVLDIARGDTLWVHTSLANAAKQAVQQDKQDISNHNSPKLPMSALQK